MPASRLVPRFLLSGAGWRFLPCFHGARLRLLCLTMPPLMALGCGTKEQRKPVFPVRGSVLVAGKPAVNALVIFHPLTDPDPKAMKPNGEVDADGKFTLNTYTAGDGAPAGEYAVTVLWLEGGASSGGDAGSGSDKLGNRYANPRTSGLRAQVREEPTELSPFHLKK